MHIKYFGDSYDVVKQSLIRWLAPFGHWSVHPMFTEAVTSAEAAAFADFLGARLLSNSVLTAKTERSTYFTCASSCDNLFLDPDTGLQIKSVSASRVPEFLFASELVSLVQKRPGFLTMVFDQSHPRGSERVSLEQKLSHLSERGISAFAYSSHACFVITGQDSVLVNKARTHLIRESRLPESRFVVPVNV
jgi:hypothetical protein